MPSAVPKLAERSRSRSTCESMSSVRQTLAVSGPAEHAGVSLLRRRCWMLVAVSVARRPAKLVQDVVRVAICWEAVRFGSSPESVRQIAAAGLGKMTNAARAVVARGTSGRPSPRPLRESPTPRSKCRARCGRFRKRSGCLRARSSSVCWRSVSKPCRAWR